MAFLFSWTMVIVLKPASLAIITLSFAEYASSPFYPGCSPPTIVTKFLAATVICELQLPASLSEHQSGSNFYPWVYSKTSNLWTLPSSVDHHCEQSECHAGKLRAELLHHGQSSNHLCHRDRRRGHACSRWAAVFNPRNANKSPRLFGCCSCLRSGKTENLSNAFEGSSTSFGAIGLAFYNGFWAYEGW